MVRREPMSPFEPGRSSVGTRVRAEIAILYRGRYLELEVRQISKNKENTHANPPSYSSPTSMMECPSSCRRTSGPDQMCEYVSTTSGDSSNSILDLERTI